MSTTSVMENNVVLEKLLSVGYSIGSKRYRSVDKYRRDRLQQNTRWSFVLIGYFSSCRMQIIPSWFYVSHASQYQTISLEDFLALKHEP
jgi:hypothetical protein